MAYEYRYINKQVFENSVAYTLLLDDPDGDKEPVRIEKSFKADDQTIDEEFLRIEAKKEIKRILTLVPDQDIVEVPPDEALSDG
jgi:hypothetical protein